MVRTSCEFGNDIQQMKKIPMVLVRPAFLWQYPKTSNVINWHILAAKQFSQTLCLAQDYSAQLKQCKIEVVP